LAKIGRILGILLKKILLLQSFHVHILCPPDTTGVENNFAD